jgi:hypothetical protein
LPIVVGFGSAGVAVSCYCSQIPAVCSPIRMGIRFRRRRRHADSPKFHQARQRCEGRLTDSRHERQDRIRETNSPHSAKYREVWGTARTREKALRSTIPPIALRFTFFGDSRHERQIHAVTQDSRSVQQKFQFPQVHAEMSTDCPKFSPRCCEVAKIHHAIHEVCDSRRSSTSLKSRNF